jgi:hypothetical protein
VRLDFEVVFVDAGQFRHDRNAPLVSIDVNGRETPAAANWPGPDKAPMTRSISLWSRRSSRNGSAPPKKPKVAIVFSSRKDWWPLSALASRHIGIIQRGIQHPERLEVGAMGHARESVLTGVPSA